MTNQIKKIAGVIAAIVFIATMGFKLIIIYKNGGSIHYVAPPFYMMIIIDIIVSILAGVAIAIEVKKISKMGGNRNNSDYNTSIFNCGNICLYEQLCKASIRYNGRSIIGSCRNTINQKRKIAGNSVLPMGDMYRHNYSICSYDINILLESRYERIW